MHLIEDEEQMLKEELAIKLSIQPCNSCTERDDKIRILEEKVEQEKVLECQKALERERIAKGMQCTRQDEVLLRSMQKLQMDEKRYREKAEQRADDMWHQVLVDDVRRKEEYERAAERRRQEEMKDRRRIYDEQIASAKRQRQEALKKEREAENRKLERLAKKMEEDHFNAIKKKQEQQMANKVNYIDGHEKKLARIQCERKKEREIDDNTIRRALEDLEKEKLLRRREMLNLRAEKDIFTENFNQIRKMASHLEEESDKVGQEWKDREEEAADKYFRSSQEDKQLAKQIAAKEYKEYQMKKQQQLDQERINRSLKMEQVRRTAVSELQKRLESANEEIRRQLEYRNSLNNQLKDNQRVMEAELKEIECTQEPFTRRPCIFKDVMKDKIDKYPARTSTNPIHPFRRFMETRSEEHNRLYLPLLSGSNSRD